MSHLETTNTILTQQSVFFFCPFDVSQNLLLFSVTSFQVHQSAVSDTWNLDISSCEVNLRLEQCRFMLALQ